MNYDNLEKLSKLHKEGVLTDKEYQHEKEKLLKASDIPGGLESRNYCTLMHLSQFLGWCFPVVGYAVPILMWVFGKDADGEIDAHGRIIINWFISAMIYGIVFGLLCIVLIGIPFVLALLVCGIIFPIIAAVKANDGERWKYPFSIDFLTVPEGHKK